MVLSDIITSLLRKFCGRWIVGFEKQNLQINTITGKLYMEKFEINTHEIKELQFPIELKQIYIGSFSADISYAHLSTKPIDVMIADIVILLGTPLNPKWDLRSLLIAEQSKIFIINKILELIAFLNPQHSERNKIPKKPFKPTQLLIDIIRNAKVEVKNVHIRFEDGLSGLDAERICQYAFGVKLDKLDILPGIIAPLPPTNEETNTQASAKNSAWSQRLTMLFNKFNDGTLQGHQQAPSRSRSQGAYCTKIIQLSSLSIYFCDDKMMEGQDVAKMLNWKLIASSDQYCDLLEPLNINICLNASFKDSSQPCIEKLDCEVALSPVKVHLTTEHYRYLICTLEGIDRFDRLMLYKRSRPAVKPEVSKDHDQPLAGKWKPWWQYAIKCVLLDLNDPAMGVSWKKTMNILLIALQYTAIRRAIKPYIIRNKFQSSSGEIFLQYRENFQGEHCVGDFSERSHFCGGVVRGVTKFGHGIADGIYGLVKNPVNSAMTEKTIGAKTLGIVDGLVSGIAEAVVHPLEGAIELAKETALGAAHSVADAVKTAEVRLYGEEANSERDHAKQLWLRQLAIESCLRPYVAAQLRFLADNQLHERQTRHRASCKEHNLRDGILTVSIAVVEGFRASTTPYCVLKVGAKGSTYTGKTVHHDKDASNSDVLCFPFLQTFEFHLGGTVNEDHLHIEFYDRSILMDQFLGNTLVNLNQITEKVSEGLVWEKAVLGQEKEHVATVRFTTCFHSKSANSSITSHDKLIEHFECHYKKERHQLYSWYCENDEMFINNICIGVTLQLLQISMAYPVIQQTEDVHLKKCLVVNVCDIEGTVAANIGARNMATSIKIGSLDIVHPKESRDEGESLIRSPVNDKTFFIQDTISRNGEPTVVSLQVGDVDVVFDVIHATKLVHRVLELPEVAKLHRVIDSPFYRALARKCFAIGAMQSVDLLVNLRMTGTIKTHAIRVMIPDDSVDSTNKALLDIHVQPLALEFACDENGIKCNCQDNCLEVPQSLRSIVTSCRGMFVKIKRQWFEDSKAFYSSQILSRHRILRMMHQLEQLQLELGRCRAKGRQVVGNPSRYNIAPEDAEQLKLTLGETQKATHSNAKVDGLQQATKSSVDETNAADSVRFALLSQGIVVLKHNRRASKPSWRMVWLSEDMSTLFVSKQRHLYASEDEQSETEPLSRKSQPVPLGSRLARYEITKHVIKVEIGFKCPVLFRYGCEANSSKYLTLYFRECPKESLSLEFANTGACNILANAIEDLIKAEEMSP